MSDKPTPKFDESIDIQKALYFGRDMTMLARELVAKNKMSVGTAVGAFAVLSAMNINAIARAEKIPREKLENVFDETFALALKVAEDLGNGTPLQKWAFGTKPVDNKSK